MCERLYEFVRIGQSMDEVQAALGQGQRIGSDEVPGSIANLIARRWPSTTIEESDEFLFYEAQHTKGSRDQHYLQFRGGKLINFDERGYESYPEFYVLH